MRIIIIPGMPRIAGRRYHIAKTLAEKGHEVHYLRWDLPYKVSFGELVKHFGSSIFSAQYRHENFTIHKISRLPFFWPYINGLLFKYQLKKLSKKIDVDFIFSQSYTNETEVPKDLPLIYDLNDDNVAMAEVYGSLIYKLAFRLLGVRGAIKRQCQNAIGITVVSDATYRIAKQYNDKVFKLSNGVDTKIIQEVKRDKLTRHRNKHSLIYVTGFNQWSQPIETMQAVMDLREEFPLLELTLVGEGTEVKKIKKFIKDNRAGGYIHYLGGVYNRKTLFSLINQSVVGLNISEKNKYRDAAQPIKIFEYTALGKKIISTDLAEVEALKFPNVFIFSMEQGSSSLLATMRKALRDDNDYEELSLQVLDDYSWTRLSDKLIALYREFS